MTRILVVEENPTTMNYLQSLLTGTPGFTVAGACNSAEAALTFMEHSIPDIVMTGINLPDKSGIELIMEVCKQELPVKCLVYSSNGGREFLFESLKAGASGYILKGNSAIDIIRAIDDVMRGGTPISPQIARHIADEFRNTEDPGSNLFTPRELEILSGIAEGLSEKKLAEKLKVSQHTTHSHIKSVYKKLQVNSKVTALIKARSRGLV